MENISSNDLWIIAIGTLMGLIARVSTLRVDLRQVPTYPSAFFSCIVMGIIASALGAIAIPALVLKDFSAITFLALAIQQFREVRKLESESLTELEDTEYVKRGKAYIDGIAKTFESRNYFALITSLSTVLVIKWIHSSLFLLNIACGVLAGFAVFLLCYRFSKGKTVGEICEVKSGTIEVHGSELYVNGLFVTNYLGTDLSRELFEQEGMAVVLSPKQQANRITLENHGQRQAILFEAVRTLGLKRYQFMRENPKNGEMIYAFVPIINDPDKLIEAVSKTPILENSRKLRRLMTTPLGGQHE